MKNASDVAGSLVLIALGMLTLWGGLFYPPETSVCTTLSDSEQSGCEMAVGARAFERL